MKTNKKVLTIIVSMLIIVSIIISSIFIYNFKLFSIKSATMQAVSIAQNVRDGLTAHMVNGTMDKREQFLNNIAKNQNIENFHLLRAPSVIKQYGDGFEGESEASNMEKEVLRTKTIQSKLIETSKKTSLQISIPYIATSVDNPNCMMCHTALKGDVLGALSMEIDISDTKSESISIIFDILIIVFILIIISILVVNFYIKPYIKLFDDLEDGISKAYKGDFSFHIETTLTNEAGKVANRLNELTEIFKFKKTIELDENKNIIYNRIIHIMETNFQIKNFIFFEINNITKKRINIFNSTNNQNDLDEDANICRAFRTSTNIYSNDFDDICKNCKQKVNNYICLNYIIDDDYSLVLHIQADDKLELNRIQKYTPIISNYFNMAKPVIETKILLGILKETTLKDPMTALYNRRFLNELLDSNISSRVKDGFVHAMLMIDIDFFKQVNDTYGHDVGDNVIKKLALIMKDSIRDSDMAVRFGGEEFIIFLPNTTKSKAVEISNNINKTFSTESFTSDIEIFTKTLSIGIAYYPNDSDSLWKTIKYADEALYVAKNTGRDQVIEFKNDMHKDGENY